MENIDWQHVKDSINKELKTAECMTRFCNKNPELLSKNYEKFFCKEHILEDDHTDCCVPIQDLDALLDTDLEMLKGDITSFLIRSPGTDEHESSEVKVQDVEDLTADVNKLDISDGNIQKEKTITQRKLSEKFQNLERILRIIKGNKGTIS